MGDILNLNGLEFSYTEPADLSTIRAYEQHEDNSPFIRQWSEDDHRRAIVDNNIAHVTIRREADHHLIGYIILIGVQNPDRSLEFKRIVIAEKGHGYGRTAVQFIKKFAFEIAGCHRLWLEVMVDNPRAYHVYESEGFKTEGIHREAILQGTKYNSFIVMSILEQEYSSQREQDAR